MCPVMSGSLSPTMLSRITERPPSAPTSAAPSIVSPFAVLTTTFLSSARKRATRAGAQLDQVRERLAAVEQRAVDVGAVRDSVRIAEALGETLVERNVDHPLGAHAVHHQQALDEDRFLLHQAPDPQGIERVPGVGRELDAGADLAVVRRLLEHHRAKPRSEEHTSELQSHAK